jgi:glycosyltransferase 2 family protein
MNKNLMLVLKLVVFAAILWVVGSQIYGQWGEIRTKPIHVNWWFVPLAATGFAGVMLTSGTVWNWMARCMGDRHPRVPLLGAYVFSQIGKYVPGKVVLLLMRVERTGRIGMTPQICVLSTLLENLFYMISGALVAGITTVLYARQSLGLYAHDHPVYLALLAVAIIPLAAILHPRVFYKIVNRMLKKFGRPPVDEAHQLGIGTLALSVLLFVPCWLFGGLSLWACLRCVGVPAEDIFMIILPGTFAASVIGGMAIGVAPGGLGPREAIQVALLSAVMAKSHTGDIVLAVGLQRLSQVLVEVTLGMAGAALTGARTTQPIAPSPETAPPDEPGSGAAGV